MDQTRESYSLWFKYFCFSKHATPEKPQSHDSSLSLWSVVIASMSCHTHSELLMYNERIRTLGIYVCKNIAAEIST